MSQAIIMRAGEHDVDRKVCSTKDKERVGEVGQAKAGDHHIFSM